MRNSKWNKELVIKTIKDIENQFRKRPIKRDSSALYQASRKHFGTWNNAMKTAGYKIFEKQNPILPKKLTPELSYFLGLLITDGHIRYNKNYRDYRVNLYTSYEEEIEIISNLINFLFKCEPRIYKKKKYGFNIRTNHNIYINSKDLAKYLNINFNIPTGAKSLSVRIPKYFFNTSKQNICSFIRGIFDGDGSINNQGYMYISSGSYNFLLGLSKLFNIVNIHKGKIIKEITSYKLYISKQSMSRLYQLIYDKAKYFYPRKEKYFKRAIFKNP